MFTFIKSLFHLEQQTSKKEKTISAIILFLYIFILGYAGSGMNVMEGSFYASLVKPGATPPSWVFPIVWTILFISIGLSGYYVWNHYKDEKYRKIFIVLYLINGILVFLWPHLFFTKELLTTTLYVIIALIIVIELMILSAFKANHKAAYLLIPYLIWVLFATYLNASFIMLN